MQFRTAGIHHINPAPLLRPGALPRPCRAALFERAEPPLRRAICMTSMRRAAKRHGRPGIKAAKLRHYLRLTSAAARRAGSKAAKELCRKCTYTYYNSRLPPCKEEIWRFLKLWRHAQNMNNFLCEQPILYFLLINCLLLITGVVKFFYRKICGRTNFLRVLRSKSLWPDGFFRARAGGVVRQEFRQVSV